ASKHSCFTSPSWIWVTCSSVSDSPSRSRKRATTLTLQPNAKEPSRRMFLRFGRRFCSLIFVMTGIGERDCTASHLGADDADFERQHLVHPPLHLAIDAMVPLPQLLSDQVHSGRRDDLLA